MDFGFLAAPVDRAVTFANPGDGDGFLQKLGETLTPATPELSAAYDRLSTAAAEETRLTQLLSSRNEALADSADNRIETVKRLTGVSLENPFRQGYLFEATQQVDNARALMSLPERDAQDRNAAIRDAQRDIFNTRVSALAEEQPDKAAGLTFGQPMEEQAAAIASNAVTAAGQARADVAAQGGGAAAGFLTELVAGLYGARRDPVSLVSLAFGPSAAAGRTIAGRVFTSAVSQGLFNVGLLALQKPEVSRWAQERRDPDSGALPSPGEIGMAFALGAIPGAAVEGVIEAKALGSLRRVMAGEFKPSDVAPALRALGLKDDELAAMMQAARRANEADAIVLADRPPGVAADAHGEAAAQALRHADDPDHVPPPGDVPAVEAEKIKAAAVKINEQVFEGANHTDALQQAAEAAGVTLEEMADRLPKEKSDVNGFVTTDGRYVDREEAYRIAKAAEQINTEKLGVEGSLGHHQVPELEVATLRRIQQQLETELIDRLKSDPLAAVEDLRSDPKMAERALASPRQDLQRAGRLANLSDDAWAQVAEGRASPEHAAIVSELSPGPQHDGQILQRLTEAQPANANDARLLAANEADRLVARQQPQARPRRQNLSLLEFIAANGGIRADDPLVADLRSMIGSKNIFVPGFGPLIRNPRELSTAARAGGRRAPAFLDTAREAAVEAGYLHDAAAVAGDRPSESTVTHLLDAMGEEIRGNKQYVPGEEPPVPIDRDHQRAFVEAERATRAEAFDKRMTELQIEPLKGLRQRALQIMEKDGERDPLLAYERALEEHDNRSEAIRRARQSEQIDVPFDAAHDAGPAPPPGGEAAAGLPERPGGTDLGDRTPQGGDGARAAGESDPLNKIPFERPDGSTVLLSEAEIAAAGEQEATLADLVRSCK